jgi:hypothetical protein
MRVNTAGILGLLLLGLAGTAGAQGPPPQRVSSSVDVNRLPLDLARIQRALRTSSVREQRDGLNLYYQVDVFGVAPPIVLFTPADNLRSGPVPYGAPTHREMIQQVTPQEYRAPAADFSGFIRWLAEKSKK